MEEDKPSFDQQWSQAFDDAEMAPPEHVWTAIDGQLSGAAANSYKSQLVIYRWVAAACILLLMVFGWGYWPDRYNNPNSSLSEKTVDSKSTMAAQENISDQTTKTDISDTKVTKPEINKELTKDSKPTIESDRNLEKFDDSAFLTSTTDSRKNNLNTLSGDNQSRSELDQSNINKASLNNEGTKLVSENTSKESNTINATHLIEKNEDTQSSSIAGSYADGVSNKSSNASKQSMEGNQTPIGENSKENSIAIKQLANNKVKQEEIFSTQMNNKDFSEHTIANSIEPPLVIYGVPVLPTKEELKQLNKLWAGVVMSTGSFNPSLAISSSDEDVALDLQEEAFDNQEALIPRTPVTYSTEQSKIQDINEEPVNYTLSSSVSGGLALGKRVRNRFIFSSGVALNTIKTNQTSTSLVDQGGDLYALTGDPLDNNLELALNDSEIEFVGNTVSISNEYKYLSIPVKAGFILLDRKFNITFNTGFSSNFLLGAQLVTDENTQSINNSSDTRDNYRDVYFNVLTSLEFGYIIAKRYQLSFEPTYNRALTDFNQSGNLDNSKPSNLGIALGIRYNF